MEGGARDVEKVGRGICCTQLAVDVKGVEGCGPGHSVGGDCLYYRSFLNLFLESSNMVFIACLANV